ncbi:MAG TPA: FHA domain-containing protein [Kofleriaceae bacterium]|nr:FHA domain-containing protein [Kofleriaceae bacterium]
MDQSKKTMRHFYCRDVLWETFEQMANDFDCSIDYLVNEAMRYYARSKNYQSPGGPQMTQGAPIAGGANSTSGPAAFPAAPAKAGPGSNGLRGNPGTQPPPASVGGGVAAGARRAQPPTPGYQGNNNANVRAVGPTGGGMAGGMGALHGPAPTTGHSPAPISTGMTGGGGGSGPTLFLIYNGQRYPVTKDQFIIGRGSKTSDLPIKDGNISRKHAAVIRRNGTFYIKDLGSTNGIDYKGMRIDNKRIDEGDVFHLCDYELRFTYRAD